MLRRGAHPLVYLLTSAEQTQLTCLSWVSTRDLYADVRSHPQDVRLHTSNLLTWINSNPVEGFFVFQLLYAVGTGIVLCQ
jgi:hypothetical protein